MKCPVEALIHKEREAAEQTYKHIFYVLPLQTDEFMNEKLWEMCLFLKLDRPQTDEEKKS